MTVFCIKLPILEIYKSTRKVEEGRARQIQILKKKKKDVVLVFQGQLYNIS